MDFKQGSKMSLLIQLQAAHALVPGSAANWTFSAPIALVDDASGFDTKVKLTANQSNVTYGSYRTFKYNRFDLETLGLNYPANPTLELTGVSRVYDCFPYLLKATSVLFDQNDLEDGDVVTNEDGTLTIPLVAKATCILWKGSWQLKTGKLPHISLGITQPYFDWS